MKKNYLHMLFGQTTMPYYIITQIEFITRFKLSGSYTRGPQWARFSAKARPSRRRSDNACLPGRPKYLITGREIDPIFDLKAWQRRGYRPSPTSLSDREYAGPLLTALPRPTQSRPTGNDRPGTPARCGPGEQAEQIR